jgi:protocatechuate 3,4-dioxygenase beta subunit
VSEAVIGADLTEEAIARLQNASDPRSREISESLTRHLHAFIREVRPSASEWFTTIEFLTRTGQMCTGGRQEFILLSDVLGVSMLVELINKRAGDGVTSNTVLGPFFVPGQPVLPMGSSILKRSEPGEPLVIKGVVRDARGEPVEGARIDVWQTAPNGLYDIQDPEAPAGHLRAAFVTGADGCYAVRTIRPTSYPIPEDGPVGQWLRAVGRHPWRPAHTHCLIRRAGLETLTTHLFIGDDAYLRSDPVFGVRPDLIVSPVEGPEGLAVHYDFGLRDAA